MSAGDFVYHTGFADNLGLNLPFDHIYNQIYTYETISRRRGSSKIKEPYYTEQENSKKEYETDAEMLGDFIETITKDEKIILSGCHFNVVFYAENEADFRCMSRWWPVSLKILNITPYAPIGENKKNLFFNSFFANVCQY